MWYVCLLDIIDLEFSILFNINACSSKIKTFSDCISSNCEENSVILFGFFFCTMLKSNMNLTFWVRFFKLYGSSTLNELCSVVFHMLSNSVGHILVKASQQNGPNHDCSVITKSSQESCTF